MARIFFSYSHDDEQYRDQLEKHLSTLKHEGLIDSWHDRRILAGSDLDKEIDAQLERADIVLLLISASFIASRYCYSIEMQRALERQWNRIRHDHAAPAGAMMVINTSPGLTLYRASVRYLASEMNLRSPHRNSFETALSIPKTATPSSTNSLWRSWLPKGPVRIPPFG